MDDNQNQGTDDQSLPAPTPVTHQLKEPFPWGGIMLAVWAVALVIFSVQNADDTSIQFLGWSFDVPVAILVIVTALVTVLITGVGLTFWRRRRLKQAKRMMEHRQLRDSSES